MNFSLRSFILCLCILPLAGCSYTVKYYLRNLTSTPAEVILVSRSNKSHITRNSAAEFSFTSKIVKISYNAHERFHEKIESRLIADSVVFTVPGNSTIYIGWASIGWPTYPHAIVRQNGSDKHIDLKHYTELRRRTEFVNRVSFWYDVQ
jgi:hypothetical protein